RSLHRTGRMKHRDAQQMSLFPPRGLLPAATAQPFALQPSPPEIRICTSRGRQIIMQHRPAEGTIEREFVSASGECWTCTHGRGKARPIYVLPMLLVTSRGLVMRREG